MTNYRAIVSITFDDDDLSEVAEAFGLDSNPDALEMLNGSLDNLELGSGWVEQLFADGRPTIGRLSGGIMVEISEHDE